MRICKTVSDYATILQLLRASIYIPIGLVFCTYILACLKLSTNIGEDAKGPVMEKN